MASMEETNPLFSEQGGTPQTRKYGDSETLDIVTRPRKRNNGVIFVLAFSLIAIGIIVAVAVVFGAEVSNQPSPEALASSVEESKIFAHLEQFYNISKYYNDSRAVKLGYVASAEYIESQLATTSYTYHRHYFNVTESTDITPPSMIIETSTQASQTFTEIASMGHTANGKVAAPLDYIRSDTLGCNAEDFNGLSGKIVAVPRGICAIYDKAVLAKAAGVAALIYGNYADEPTRVYTRNVIGNNEGETVDLVMLGTSGNGYAKLETLIDYIPDINATVETNTRLDYVETFNIIADHPHGNQDTIVISGSHLDSVEAGPGINDNGSGSAMNLEMALTLDKSGTMPVNGVRFCWFGAEELGLLGSRAYVNDLKKNTTELSRIAAMLNFDMMASPNYARQIYHGAAADSEGNHFGPHVALGSGNIQSIFESHFKTKNLDTILTSFDGRSDYGPFIENNISAGGLATGAEKLKTPEQVKMFGGVANVAYDPCYHQACDDLDNINRQGLQEMTEASAYGFFRLILQEDIINFLYSNSTMF